MSSKRMQGTERRAQIIAAARRVFSRSGYHGAKTLRIAREAGVSEALVYRHFPSKLSLYRAVLRQVFNEQDRQWQELGIHQTGATGLIRAIHTYLRACVEDGGDPERLDSHRMTLASLSGDGSFASLVYRRSLRKSRAALQRAFDAAAGDGDIDGRLLHVPAATMFIEHVGTMIGAIGMLPPGAQPYGLAGGDLATQAAWFCCRGIGMNDAVIARHLGEDGGQISRGQGLQTATA